MEETEKKEAMQASYALTEEILELLCPTAVVSCQCGTNGRWEWDQYAAFNRRIYDAAQNKLARDLCSKVCRAERQQATEIACPTFRFWYFWGFHPRYHDFGWKKELADILIQLFNDVYGPYSYWKNEVLPALELEAELEKKSALIELVSALDNLYGVIKKHRLVTTIVTTKLTQLVNEISAMS